MYLSRALLSPASSGHSFVLNAQALAVIGFCFGVALLILAGFVPLMTAKAERRRRAE